MPRMKKEQRIIYFNGRFLAQPKTGVQRFAEEIITEIDGLVAGSTYSNYEFICLVPPENFPQGLPNWQNVKIQSCGRLRGNLWEQIDLPFAARNGMLIDLCNTGPVLHPLQIAVIHDASVFAVPEAYSTAFRLKYKFIYLVLAHTALKILTISHFSKKELSHHLHVKEEKITVLSEGCEHILRTQADHSILDKFSLRGQPYFLAVGSASRHKNLNIVIEAIQSCAEECPRLVIVGGSFSRVFRSEEAIPADKLIRLGYVTDAQLRSLYENALAFVFPSLYEGFGLPPLEAMVCGCPVMASNTTSLPEVCGDAALYFDPMREEQIASSIRQLTNMQALRSELKEKGRQRALQFTWNKAAGELLQIVFAELCFPFVK